MLRGALDRIGPLAERARSLSARQAIGGGVILLVLGGVAIAVLPGGGGGSASASGPGGPTVPLERRDLTSTVNVDGTLGFRGEAEMINRLQGTITWLPGVGDVIRRGDRAFSVDGKPVILMYGEVPAYRELSDGVSDGADVKQLERNLAALGFDDGGAMSVDDSFTSATAAAVSDWQDSVGLPRTGSVELGRVVFAPGPRRVESLDVALGSDAAGGGGNGSAASGLYDEPWAPTTLASSKTPSGGDGASNSGGGNGSGSDGGSGSTASTDVLTTTSLRRAVTVDLDPNQLSLARRGRPARINLPDGSSTNGRITSVGTTASSSGSGSGNDSSSSTVAVTARGLDQAPVTVDLIDQLRRNVLAVPVSALVGTAGGHYAIVVDQGTERRQIPVQPGLFADSYVEVSGPGLSEGMRVEVPQI
jgi:hypothetical protein